MRGIVVLGTAHRLREQGKRSPDGKLREAVYSREIVSELKPKLEDAGFIVFVDMEALDLPKEMQNANAKIERNTELSMRVKFVNDVCKKYGKDKVVYVSIHCNASSSDNQWHSACGWQVCVGTKAGDNSKKLANCMFESAQGHWLKMRRPSISQKYWEQSIYVLNNTACPAILTENLFQDNKKDVEYLLSDEGRHNIERLHAEGIIKYFSKL